MTKRLCWSQGQFRTRLNFKLSYDLHILLSLDAIHLPCLQDFKDYQLGSITLGSLFVKSSRLSHYCLNTLILVYIVYEKCIKRYNLYLLLTKNHSLSLLIEVLVKILPYKSRNQSWQRLDLNHLDLLIYLFIQHYCLYFN